MYWTEDESPDAVAVPDDVVDVLFAIECRQLPVDHAHALSAALIERVPWLADEPAIGIHTVHVAGSQNGWERPAHGPTSMIQLSRRTRLTLRVPKDRIAPLLAALPGTRIQVGGCPLAVGPGKIRPLSRETTLFARYVVGTPGEDEGAFLAAAVRALGQQGIGVKKALCGKAAPLATPAGPLPTRSLMLADLTPDESFRLQREGLGPRRSMGCGIFIPHKGIDAVGGAAR